MEMRFQVADSQWHSGQIVFRFSRRTTDGRERVRLLGFSIRWIGNPERHDVLRHAAQSVLEQVALPRHRYSTEQTIANIARALHEVTGEPWRCMNTLRAMRRRRSRTVTAYATSTRVTEPRRQQRSIVHSYSYKPNPRFQVGRGESGTTSEFFGIELEVDQQPERESLDPGAVPDVASPLFYCKQDGSLENGVELVSHPGSRLWWNEQRGNVEAILTRLSQMGWRSHETRTCGMHIHISLTAFSESMHIYRFLHLMYRFPALSLLVSQRSSARLNQWASLRYNRKPSLKQKAALRLKVREYSQANNSGHYDGVNRTGSTFEVRIFNGTLKPASFYKNLQYTTAVLDFTRDIVNLRHITPANFVMWVNEREADYPDLAQFLRERQAHPALKVKRITAPWTPDREDNY